MSPKKLFSKKAFFHQKTFFYQKTFYTKIYLSAKKNVHPKITFFFSQKPFLTKKLISPKKKMYMYIYILIFVLLHKNHFQPFLFLFHLNTFFTEKKNFFTYKLWWKKKLFSQSNFVHQWRFVKNNLSDTLATDEMSL